MIDKELFKSKARDVKGFYQDFDSHLWAFCSKAGTQDYVYELMTSDESSDTDDVWAFYEWLEDRIEDGDLEPIR